MDGNLNAGKCGTANYSGLVKLISGGTIQSLGESLCASYAKQGPTYLTKLLELEILI